LFEIGTQEEQKINTCSLSFSFHL